MDQYWLIYRRFDANKRQTKPFSSKDAAIKWAIKNDYEILGIAEQHDNQCITARLTNFIDKISQIKDESDGVIRKCIINDIIERMQNLRDYIEEE